MRYDPAVENSHEWDGKYPPGANYSENVAIWGARLVLQDARGFDEVINRESRDRWTVFSLDYTRKQLERRIDQLETTLERDFDDPIDDYMEAILAHAQAVLVQDDSWVQPVVTGTCTWKKIRRSPYEQAENIDYKANREVDITSIHRHPKRRQLRVRTDGDDFHNGIITLNDLSPVTMIERGRTGTLFLGKY